MACEQNGTSETNQSCFSEEKKQRQNRENSDGQKNSVLNSTKGWLTHPTIHRFTAFVIISLAQVSRTINCTHINEYNKCITHNFTLVCVILKEKMDSLRRKEQRKKKQQLLLHSSEFNANKFTMTTSMYFAYCKHTKNFSVFSHALRSVFSSRHFHWKTSMQKLWYNNAGIFLPSQKRSHPRIFYWLAVG